MNKVPVSVVVITKNEEDNIAECLESVKWAGEIIVVDDDSTDRTREIASGYGKVFERKMENEGRHRNWAYAQASNKWVLSLDADERITPELAVEIAELVKGNPEFKAYTIPRRNHIGDYWLKWGGEYPAAQTRLFLKDEFKYEEAEVHPRALMEGDCGHLKGDMIHYSHRDIEDYVRSLNGHTTLEAKKWFLTKRNMSFFHAFWRALDRCFYRRLWRKKAGKDGVYGLCVAVQSGIYQLVSWVKCWEMEQLPVVSRQSSASQSVHVNGGGASVGQGTPSYRTPLGRSDVPSPVAGARGQRQKLSVVILTKNCADKVRNCLESVKWADEIIIVDGHSTDGTVEIAREYTDKVIDSEFEGFGEERNKGARQASGNWILELDADEIVTDAFRERMFRLLSGEDGGCSAFKFRRKNVFLGRTMMRGGWYHYSAHLFRKGRARYEGDIHEKLLVDGVMGTMEEEIVHYPFMSMSEFITRQNRYTTLQAKEMFREDPDIPEKTVMYNIKTKPVKLFNKMYIKKLGCLEGMQGLVFSTLFAWVHFLKWAKYWELRRRSRDIVGASAPR